MCLREIDYKTFEFCDFYAFLRPFTVILATFFESFSEGKDMYKDLLAALLQPAFLDCRFTWIDTGAKAIRYFKEYEEFCRHKKAPSENEAFKIPRPGVEPGRPKAQDFESSASANSAIWAYEEVLCVSFC